MPLAEREGIQRLASLDSGPIRATLLFISSFGLAKFAAYSAPIAVAAIAPPYVYATIEVAQALAMLMATLFAGGPIHAINHRHLADGGHERHGPAAGLVAICCWVGFVCTFCGFFLGLPPVVLLSLSIFGLAATQIVFSFHLRSLAAGNWAVPWVEGLVVYLGLLFAAGLLLFTSQITPAGLTRGYLAGAIIIAFGVSAFLWQDRSRGFRLLEAIRKGLAMSVYAGFATWVAVSGRVLMGAAAPQDLPAYAVAFRLASFAVLVPQLVLTGLWRPLYTCSQKRADALISVALVVTALAAAAVSFAGRHFLSYAGLEALDFDARQTCQTILPIVALQMFFWSAHMMLQPLINRDGAAGASLGPMSTVTVTGAISILAAAQLGISPVGLVWIIAGYSASYFLLIWLLLGRRGFGLPRTATVAVAGALCLSLLGIS